MVPVIAYEASKNGIAPRLERYLQKNPKLAALIGAHALFYGEPERAPGLVKALKEQSATGYGRKLLENLVHETAKRSPEKRKEIGKYLKVAVLPGNGLTPGQLVNRVRDVPDDELQDLVDILCAIAHDQEFRRRPAVDLLKGVWDEPVAESRRRESRSQTVSVGAELPRDETGRRLGPAEEELPSLSLV